MKRCYPFIALLLLPFSSFGAPVFWNEDFSGSSMNSNFSIYRTYGDMTAVQAAGKLTFTSPRTSNFSEVHLVTATDQAGNTEIDDKRVFNFFERPISIKVDEPLFSGPISSGTPYSFFLLIGAPDQGNPLNLQPRTAFSGAFARIDYRAGGELSIVVGDRLIGGSSLFSTMAVTGTPSSIEFILDGTQWRLKLEGATFSDGRGTIADGSFTQLTSQEFEAQTYFSMGIVAIGELAPGSAPYSVSLNHLSIAQADAIPEAGHAALWLTGGIVMLAWGMRKKSEPCLL